MRLPSRSGLGQSSVGLVYAVRCPHSEEPTLGGYDKRPKFMYLYFMPFHHHINLGSTVLYFFFCSLFLSLSALFHNFRKLVSFWCSTMLPFWLSLPTGLFLNYFLYPQPRLAMLLPPPELSHCYTRFRLCLPVHTLLFAARLYRIVPSILGLEQSPWDLGLRILQGSTNWLIRPWVCKVLVIIPDVVTYVLTSI